MYRCGPATPHDWQRVQSGVCSLLIDTLFIKESDSTKKLWKVNALIAVVATTAYAGTAYFMLTMMMLCAGTNKIINTIKYGPVRREF